VISTADHPGTSGSDSLAGADPILARAVDEARAALVEQVGAEVVGDPQGFVSEGSHAVTQYFDCTQAGYPGWRWAVTVAHAEGFDGVTIDEVVLLPGEAAITAPTAVATIDCGREAQARTEPDGCPRQLDRRRR